MYFVKHMLFYRINSLFRWAQLIASPKFSQLL